MQKSGAPTLDLALALFVSNTTPYRTTLYADLTWLVTDPTEIVLTPSGWQSAALVDNKARMFWGADYTILTNHSGSSADVYGFGVYDRADDTLMWAERFDDVITLAPDAELKVWPFYDFTSAYDPTPP